MSWRCYGNVLFCDTLIIVVLLLLKIKQYHYSKIQPNHLKGNLNLSTPEDKYISLSDSDMTFVHVIWNEACTLIKSFSNPKKETAN